MPPKAKPKRYAEGTAVPVDKSRAELEALLDRHGATEMVVHRDAQRTTIIYRMHERMVRHYVVAPSVADFKKSEDRYLHGEARKAARQKQMEQAAVAEHRRRWRVLLLIVKAKLELIASGESSFEREFLADILLPNNETVGEALLPRLADAYRTGDMPLLLPGKNP